MQNKSLITAVRWVTIIALFIIPFLPLFVADNYFFLFITGKNFGFRILTEIAFAGWAVLALADQKYRPKFSWTFVLFTAFVFWMAIADAFAINPVKAFWSNFERMDGWVTLIHVWMLFVVTGAFLPAENLWKKWWGTFVIGAAAITAYCVMQLVCKGHACAVAFGIHQGGVRVDATFGNSEYLAAYLLFAIAITIWLFVDVTLPVFTRKWSFSSWPASEWTRSSAWWLKISLGVLAAVEILMLLFSETRGAIIGAAGAVVLAGLLWAIESGSKGRKLALTAVVIMFVLALGTFVGRNTAFVQHIPGVDRVASISLSDTETTARFKIWHMAYQGFLDRPVVGWGQEGFNYVFNKYYDPSLYSQEQWFDRAHDLFLDWLVAGGAPALLFFIAYLVAAVWGLYRAPVARSERILLLAALAAYLFQGLFVFDNLFTYVPLAVILAMAHAVSSKPWRKIPTLPVFSDSTFAAIILPIGVVGLGLMFWFVNVPNMRAATDLITAITPTSDQNDNITAFKVAYADGSFAYQEITEQLIAFAQSTIQSSTVDNATKLTVFTYALQQTQGLVAKVPNDARIRFEFAQLLRSSGNYTQALDQIHAAEALSPKKQSIIQEEGLDYWLMGSSTPAEAAFTRAFQLDTTNKAAAASAAASAIAAGDIQGGKTLLNQVYGTTTVNNDSLVIAYYQAKDFPDLIAVLTKRVEETNGSVTAEFQLAEAYADSGQLAQARVIIQQTITQHPEAASQGAAILAQIPSTTSTTK